MTIGEVAFAGRYAGSVATHEIFLARSDGTPVPNHREIQEATLLIIYAVRWKVISPRRTLSKCSSVRFFPSPMMPLFTVSEGPIWSTVSRSPESLVNSALNCSSGSSIRYPVTLGNSIRRWSLSGLTGCTLTDGLVDLLGFTTGAFVNSNGMPRTSAYSVSNLSRRMSVKVA